jgi:uncharacterized protein (DUF58 family)
MPPPRLFPPALPKAITATPPPVSKLLSIEELERFKNLVLFAQATVDGLYAGQHPSPFSGSSSEFRDYRDYAPGDEIDRIDWRAYGRTRRLVVRRYEDETDMVVYLLVDTSASMRYAGEKRLPKFQHAARLAAALSYLAIRQGDKAALALCADTLQTYLPPGGTRRHLHEIATALDTVYPNLTTGIGTALEQCAGVFKKRGKLVVLSDFFTEPGPLFDALSQFLHRDFSILLFQVLDPDELDLPNRSATQFVDLETGSKIEVDPDDLRAAYQKSIQTFLAALAAEANARTIEHQLVNTAEPYTSALEAYLGFRRGER